MPVIASEIDVLQSRGGLTEDAICSAGHVDVVAGNRDTVRVIEGGGPGLNHPSGSLVAPSAIAARTSVPIVPPPAIRAMVDSVLSPAM